MSSYMHAAVSIEEAWGQPSVAHFSDRRQRAQVSGSDRLLDSMIAVRERLGRSGESTRIQVLQPGEIIEIEATEISQIESASVPRILDEGSTASQARSQGLLDGIGQFQQSIIGKIIPRPSDTRDDRALFETKRVEHRKTMIEMLEPELETEGLCAICHDFYELGQKRTALACGHEYHHECVRTWVLGRRSDCPTCRAKIEWMDE